MTRRRNVLADAHQATRDALNRAHKAETERQPLLEAVRIAEDESRRARLEAERLARLASAYNDLLVAGVRLAQEMLVSGKSR
jgi:hypothetical protein